MFTADLGANLRILNIADVRRKSSESSSGVIVKNISEALYVCQANSAIERAVRLVDCWTQFYQHVVNK